MDGDYMIQLKHLHGGIYIIDNDPVLQDYILYNWKNSDIGFIFSPDLRNEITYIYGSGFLFSNLTEKEYNNFFDYVKNHMSEKFRPTKDDSIIQKIKWTFHVRNMYRDFKTEIQSAVLERRSKISESV
jgi:hypothetical protein